MTFLRNFEVGFRNGYSVKRHIHGKWDQEIIDGPHAQAEYIKFMNAVDSNNSECADFSILIWTNKY